MNQNNALEYFFKTIIESNKGRNADDYTIDSIEEYYNSKTESIGQIITYGYGFAPNPNGYLITYTFETSMRFKGKYFVLNEDIRDWLIDNVIK